MKLFLGENLLFFLWVKLDEWTMPDAQKSIRYFFR